MYKIKGLVKGLPVFYGVLCLVITSGCAQKTTVDFRYTKNKSITMVETRFKRPADNIEDWGDYKRYTWLMCRSTDKQVTEPYMVNNEINYRVKQEVDCCPVVFKVDINSRVVDYSNVETCADYLNAQVRK